MIFSGALKENPVVLFVKDGGEISSNAIKLLKYYGIRFHTITISQDEPAFTDLFQKSGWHLLPQLFVKGEFIGGNLLLNEFIESGELNRILEHEIYISNKKPSKEQAIWRIDYKHPKLISSSANGEINIYDEDLNLTSKLFKGKRWVNSVKFSLNSSFIAACFTDTKIRIWNNFKLISTLIGHNRWVNEIEFINNDCTLVSAGADGKLIFWDLINQKFIKSLEAHNGSIWTISKFLKDRYIISAGFDKKIKIWETKDYKLVNEFLAHENCITKILQIPESDTFLSTSYDATIKLWNIKGDNLYTFKDHGHRIWSLAVDNNKKTFASCSADNKIYIWDLINFKLQKTCNFDSMPLSCVYSHDGTELFVSFFNGEIEKISLEL